MNLREVVKRPRLCPRHARARATTRLGAQRDVGHRPARLRRAQRVEGVVERAEARLERAAYGSDAQLSQRGKILLRRNLSNEVGLSRRKRARALIARPGPCDSSASIAPPLPPPRSGSSAVEKGAAWRKMAHYFHRLHTLRR